MVPDNEHAKKLKNLIQPHVGGHIADGGQLRRLSQLMQQAPEVAPERLDQIAALPLGARLVVDPWTSRLDLLKTAATGGYYWFHFLRAITAVSPSSVAADYRQLYAQATMRPSADAAASDSEALRPASIAPSRTVLGLAFLAAFTILLVGITRGISAVGAQRIARGIAVLGVVVALVGIIQKAVGSEAVYGLWYPPKGSVPFAPFISFRRLEVASCVWPPQSCCRGGGRPGGNRLVLVD